MEEQNTPKKIHIQFEGPIELSTGSAPGGFASFSIPINKPTEANINLGGDGKVSFDKGGAKPSENLILQDMKSKFKLSLTLLDKLKDIDGNNREDFNSHLSLFIETSKGVINLFVGRQNVKVLKELKINSEKLFLGWESNLSEGDKKILSDMKNYRELSAHERLVRPNKHITIKLQETLRINVSGTEKTKIKISEIPAVTSELYTLEGQELFSCCQRYLELLTDLINLFESQFIKNE